MSLKLHRHFMIAPDGRVGKGLAASQRTTTARCL